MAILWKTGSEFTTEYPDGYGKPSVKVPRPTYDGAVLGTTGRDERIMSDVWAWITYARVWDGTKVREVAIGNSEFGSDGTATVDATPEVLAATAAWEAVKAAEKAAADKARRLEEVLLEAARVTRGKEVTVVRGRKVPKGSTGRVFWIGAGKWGTRVGIEPATGERFFTAIGNVEVTDPTKYADEDLIASLKAA